MSFWEWVVLGCGVVTTILFVIVIASDGADNSSITDMRNLSIMLDYYYFDDPETKINELQTADVLQMVNIVSNLENRITDRTLSDILTRYKSCVYYVYDVHHGIIEPHAFDDEYIELLEYIDMELKYYSSNDSGINAPTVRYNPATKTITAG